MARLMTRIADLCRQRAAEDLFLRRFRMMRMEESDDDRAGPGWYESSRELERGLQVREDAAGNGLFAEWLAENQRPLPPPAHARA